MPPSPPRVNFFERILLFRNGKLTVYRPFRLTKRCKYCILQREISMEKIAHIRIEDRDFNLYISFSYTTMTLHAYKYDETSIEYEWFVNLLEFKLWVQKPLRNRTRQYSINLPKSLVRFAGQTDSYMRMILIQNIIVKQTSSVEGPASSAFVCCFLLSLSVPSLCIYYSLIVPKCQPLFSLALLVV